MGNFSELDMYLFGQATHYDIYKKMGAHVQTKDGIEGVYFDAVSYTHLTLPTKLEV